MIFGSDRVVEGPRRGLSMEQDMEERKSQEKSTRWCGRPRSALSSWSRISTRRPQGALVSRVASHHLTIPEEVGGMDDDSVSSGISLNLDLGGVAAKETTYYDVLMGSANKSMGTATTGSDASDTAVADPE